MKKFVKEFKTFISKGSVMDLAVGMIIGSAFTAIITALVKNILTPLINWIPGSGQTGALQTVLRQPVLDNQGNVLTEALILDWGAVVSAVITFLCTALVLFFIIKGVNKFKEAKEKAKEEIAEAIEKRKKKEEEEQASIEQETISQQIAAELPTETTEDLLKQIIDLLREKNTIE